MSSAAGPARVLLLVPARTYRAADFLTAASRLGVELAIGSDGALPLGGHPVVHVSPADPEGTVGRIMALDGRLDAVVAADTPMLMLAAVVAERMDEIRDGHDRWPFLPDVSQELLSREGDPGRRLQPD